MIKYIEKIIPSQCRVINNETGYIHLEGESMILRPDGSYAGTVTTTIGSIRENHIDTVIEMLTKLQKENSITSKRTNYWQNNHVRF